MRVSFIFATFTYAATSYATSAEIDVFNVTITPSGLAIPFRQADEEVINVELSTRFHVWSMRLGDIRRYPLVENISQARVGLAAPYGPHVSIAKNSPIANFYRYAMLAPSREGDGFQLLAGLADPTEYCYRGDIFTARFFEPVAVVVGTSLIPNPSRLDSTHVAAAATTSSAIFEIDTSRRKDAIPREVYDALVEELTVLRGRSERGDMGALNFTDLIAQMPSIQYTIYRAACGDAVSNVVLAPEDYIALNPNGSFELQVEPFQYAYLLGINFLRNVAIHLNYAENTIGFCDPF